MFFNKSILAISMALSAAAVSTPNMARDLQARGIQGTHSGDATWYATGLGACGITNDDSDFIAAASHTLFDTYPGYKGGNPNNNPICNKKVTAHYQGKKVTVKITDRCVGCAEWDLDFSPAAFSQLANEDVGRLHGMTWSFD